VDELVSALEGVRVVNVLTVARRPIDRESMWERFLLFPATP
jgi:hypothetical protein